MPKPDLVILVGRKLTLADWQRGIDKENFLVPLVLDPSQTEEGVGVRRAKLGGEDVSFAFEERTLSAVGPAAEQAQGARFAFATPGSGDIKSCAAGGMALLAYMI